jgi:hypothetical protein
MSDADWDALVRDSRSSLDLRQADTFVDLDASVDWHYDLDDAVLEFSRVGAMVRRFRVVLAGTTSNAEGTWLWSWANESLSRRVTQGIEDVRRFGEANGFDGLTQSEWPAQDPYVGDVAAVAGNIIGAIGYFRAIGRDVTLYFLLTEPIAI